ncbi:hypothetical protein ACP70R_011057 [Stipagrostis hirtigluma subsp. patula]
MDSISIQMPEEAAPAADAGDMAGAARDDEKLRRALVGGGVAKLVAALLLALTRAPGGVFLRGGARLCYAYYGALVGVALFGCLKVAVGFWVAGDPRARRGAGNLVVWASVVPLVLVAGLGGFAVLK